MAMIISSSVVAMFPLLPWNMDLFQSALEYLSNRRGGSYIKMSEHSTHSLAADDHHDVVGCQEKESGESFFCSCSTGMMNVMDKNDDKTLLVFNQCYKGIRNGAFHGIQEVALENDTKGLAVYSPFSRNLCDPQDKCVCTCFDKESVQGKVSFHTKSQQFGNGLISDCLGLCGPHCALGVNVTTRYANILIHDVCQSFIRSVDPMPNRNNCSDEGWAALPGAILTVMKHGRCPYTE